MRRHPLRRVMLGVGVATLVSLGATWDARVAVEVGFAMLLAFSAGVAYERTAPHP